MLSRSTATSAVQTTGIMRTLPVTRLKSRDLDALAETEPLERDLLGQREEVGPARLEAVAGAEEERPLAVEVAAPPRRGSARSVPQMSW